MYQRVRNTWDNKLSTQHVQTPPDFSPDIGPTYVLQSNLMHHLQDQVLLNYIYIYTQGIHKRMVRFQKLTRNLFLTLHGHNVHRQQRQLSKFPMRYQQVASHACCGAAGPLSKMASQHEEVFCVLRFEVFRSVITVQREFRARFRKYAPCTPHFHRNLRVLLNRVLQQRWIGSAAKGDNHLLPRPPRLPDLTLCDLFLWGFVKDSVYVPPLPMSLKELRDLITHALQNITADIVHRVWDEFDYRVDVCRVTQCAHIEGL